MMWWRSRREAGLVIGFIVTVIAIIVAAIGPWLAPHPPLDVNLSCRLEGASWQHLLGTDELGRDVLSRLIMGSRISLLIGLVGTGFATVIGGICGSVSALYGGILDAVAMRFIDVLLSFPGILLAIMIIAVIGTGITPVILAAGVSGVPSVTRTVRSCVLSIKENTYVESARAIGVPDRSILVKHILPNALSPIIVLTTLNIGNAILTASGLSFLGLGVQPPAPEWGAMISAGRAYMRVAPHLIAAPGIALFCVVMGFNLLGDGLRDVLDPHVRMRR